MRRIKEASTFFLGGGGGEIMIFLEVLLGLFT